MRLSEEPADEDQIPIDPSLFDVDFAQELGFAPDGPPSQNTRASVSRRKSWSLSPRSRQQSESLSPKTKQAFAKSLSPEERELALQRLRHDGIASSGAEGADRPSHTEALRLTFRDWRLYPLIIMYMLATGSQTIQYFIPSKFACFTRSTNATYLL